MAEMVNLQATVKRQSTPGSLLVIAIALIAFGPRLWDTVIGEPWIDNSLAVVETSVGRIVVEDTTVTNESVSGLRANTVESEDGTVLCSTEHHNTWHGERKRFWQIAAFTNCAPPTESYRVCSRFAISSDSGRQRQFGPFCSGLTQPVIVGD